MSSWALWLLLLFRLNGEPAAGGEPEKESSCWSFGFSAEACCNTEKFGPKGNAGCWDGQYTFERCCASFQAEEQLAPQSLAVVPERERYVGVGMFTQYEPGKDCWTGSPADFESCCDLKHGPKGLGQCWNMWRYNFERCCFVGQASPTGPRKPLLPLPPPAQLPPPASGAESRRPTPVGTECWKNGFTWATCCTPHSSLECWDDTHTHDGCCNGIAVPPQVWTEVRQTDPAAVCLTAVSNLALDLGQTARQCSQGRYFYLASSGPQKVTLDTTGQPWWLQFLKGEQGRTKDFVERFRPVRPHKNQFVGGLCVPASCSLDVTASYLAPLVVPWWRTPRPVPRPLNETHALLPPRLAMQQKIYPPQREARVWIAARPPSAEAVFEDKRSWEFAINEYKRSVLISWKGILMFGVSLAGIMMAGWFFPKTESEFYAQLSESFLAPQYHVLRLGLARGPRHLDVVRCWLTVIVVFMHVLDHGPWLPVDGDSSVAWMFLVRGCMNRVNVGFVVLMVHLNFCRRSLKQAARFRSWLSEVVYYAVRRWFVIGPVVAFWTNVFVNAPILHVPLNNLLKSHGLYVWYGEQRTTCESSAHLLSSMLLAHEPIMGTRSPCHNSDIFEGLFQVDVFVFMLLSALGRASAGQAAAALWVPSLLYSYLQVDPGFHGLFNGAGHRFCWLLPPALATLAMSAGLNALEQRWRTGRPPPGAVAGGSWRSSLLCAFGGVCIFVSCLQDSLTMSQFQWPTEKLRRAASFFKWLHAPNREYVVPCHVYELLFVFGFLILLRQGGSPSPAREKWSLLRFMSRLSCGICISNLFVLHFVAAFLHDEPSELSIFSGLAFFLMTYVSSVLLTIFVLLIIEGPFACILTDGFPHPVTPFPAAAAAA